METETQQQRISRFQNEARDFQIESNKLNHPLGVLAETFKGIGQYIKGGFKKTFLTFPTREDFNKLQSKNISIEEKERIKDKFITSANIFSVGSLEAKGQPIIKKGFEIVKEEIKKNPAIQKLINAIREAKPAQKQLGALQSIERGKRAGAAGGVLEQGKGESGFYEALGKLKGELVPEGKRPVFEGLREGKEAFTQARMTLEPSAKNLLEESYKDIPKIKHNKIITDAEKFAKNSGKDKITQIEILESVGFNKLTKLPSKESQYYKYLEEVGILKTSVPKELQSLSKINQQDADELFKGIQQHPSLDVYEKINAQSGLLKLFEGEIPQKNQISLLEDTFGSDLIKVIMSKRSFFQKAGDIAIDILNIPRSLITSFDMSAPLRQGIIFTVTKPKQSIPAFGSMFKQAFSQKAFDGYIDAVKSSPEYKLIKQSNLYISDPSKISGGISAREEAFMSNLAEKIPIIGSIVKASGRAYTGYLNKLRVDVFNSLSKNLIKSGMDPKNNAVVFKDLADFVNNATGRGNLGKLNRAGAIMNNIFFSPRLIASRFNMLNPVWYAQKSPAVRKEAIKSMAQFIAFGSTILTIANAGGAEVELDPRSTDFGKIRVGNTRWDIWGGFQQWIRVFSQIISGQRKTAKGDIIDLSKKKFPFETRLDVTERFFRGKLAPIPSLALELFEGQKLFGEELQFKKEALDKMIPLYLQGIQETIDDVGSEAIFSAGIPSFFGIGVQTYEEKTKGLSDIWK